jgi:quercetin dioxygenase-like cupin family protein
MPVLFNCDSVEPESMGDGVTRQPLITPERVKSDCLLLDRWTLDAGASARIDVGDKDLVWFQLLQGEATLDGSAGKHELTTSHVIFLPPGFAGELHSADGASVLYAGVPDANRYDPAFDETELEFRCVDWRGEPTLDSEHDARKRIYLVTPTLFGTKAVKGEMIIYPPGTEASNHHHEGAEHFQYFVSGRGTALLDGEPHTVRAGDVLYNYEFERHNFVNDGDEDMVFVEYFVPAECRTVWVNPELVCAWLPTGRNIDGGQPSRDIAAHSSAETVNPEGV